MGIAIQEPQMAQNEPHENNGLLTGKAKKI